MSSKYNPWVLQYEVSHVKRSRRVICYSRSQPVSDLDRISTVFCFFSFGQSMQWLPLQNALLIRRFNQVCHLFSLNASLKEHKDLGN